MAKDVSKLMRIQVSTIAGSLLSSGVPVDVPELLYSIEFLS